MDPVYLAGSLIGVSLIVGLNVLLFGRTKPALGSLGDIAARLAADIPGFRAGAGVVAIDGSAALIEDASTHSLFLVKAIGDRVVTRKIARGTIRSVASEGCDLKLRLGDFTLGNATLALADTEAVRTWGTRLKEVA
jgi:hypothetical protein